MLEKLQDNPNSDALNWLLEMELLSNPQVLNSIILNIFKSVKGLKDAEFLIDERSKKLLIYLQINKFNEMFFKRKIENKVMEMLDSVLPNFKKRIVFDRTILEKAIKMVNGGDK